MRTLALLPLAAVMSAPAHAVECRLDGPAWLAGRIAGAGERPLARAVDARRGETIDVYLVAPGRMAGKRVLFSDAPGPRTVSWQASGCPAVEVRWWRVEPLPVHNATPSPNRSTDVYSNAVVFGPDHGRWIGWDTIEYAAGELAGGGWRRSVRDARPGDPGLDGHDGLGVMRLAAAVSLGGRTLARTPGADDRDAPGISDRVFRYTFRAGDDFLGWLTSYFNVPYLFASAGHRDKAQAERYVGADCADVLVAALRRSGRRDLDYSSVAGLIDLGKKVAGPVVIDGEAYAAGGARGVTAAAASAPAGVVSAGLATAGSTPAGLATAGSTPAGSAGAGSATAGLTAAGKPPAARARLRFGSDVRPGDLLVIDYVGWDGSPREWDHIVAVVEDRMPDGSLEDGHGDGWLGPEDLVADSGDRAGLLFQPLARQGKVRVMVVRVSARAPNG